jgi:hypothetical protein
MDGLTLLRQFENAVARAWTLDTEDGFNDKDRKSTKEAHAKVEELREQLKILLDDPIKRTRIEP